MPAKPAHLPRLLLLSLLAVLGCGGDASGPTANCTGVTPTTLAVGGHAVLDPSLSSGCVRIPAAGAGGAEYLLVALSAPPQETPAGAAGAMVLKVSPEGAPSAMSVQGRSPASKAAPGDAGFHDMLRRREAELARSGATVRSNPGLRQAPMVGDTKTFKVCATFQCRTFVPVRSTAKYVGAHAAIFLDDTIPAGGLTQADLDSLGTLFDQYLYPIDTTAFGRESDIDGNGVVSVLLSDQVNALSSQCQQTGTVVLGYFFGLDLSSDPNSNHGEVFYGLVPDPANPVCFPATGVKNRLAGVFIHEFQHMISFNRHVLLGGGGTEETWLNEGLSHFAEELGGRQVPNGYCALNNCLDQFLRTGNLRNAFGYLTDPLANFVVLPGNSAGSPDERGADWLFVRWLADRAGSDSVLGTSMTRRLLGADLPGGLATIGAANVVSAAQAEFAPGAAFGTLLGEWHLSNYTESLVGYAEPSGRVGYRSWDFGSVFSVIFPGPYPLVVDSIGASSYAFTGTLPGGSGKTVRLVQGADGPSRDVTYTTTHGQALAPRLAVLRIH